MEAIRNSMLMIILILCTITIIWTNYLFSKQTVINLNNTLTENEYIKIWWKENYVLLQEIQKREIMTYLNKIRTEQPDLVNEILISNKEWENYKILSDIIINDLKKDVYIKGKTDATYSIIDFSDFECTFCIKEHNEQNISKVAEWEDSDINYVFKNFPLPVHKNSQMEAEASKCVEKIAGWEKYIEFVNGIFSKTKWGWEWFSLEDLNNLAKKLEINTDKFNSCLKAWETKEIVAREFEQWAMIWVKSVPSKLIINNKTWRYKLITEAMDASQLDWIIEELSE